MSVLNPAVTAVANKIAEKRSVTAARAASVKFTQAFKSGQYIKLVEACAN